MTRRATRVAGKAHSAPDLPEFPWNGPLRKLFAYWRTRRAVLQGAKLWRWPKDRIAKHEYLGPWAFNLAETALAGGPTLVVQKTLLLLPAWEEEWEDHLYELDMPVHHDNFELYIDVVTWLSPFLVPLYLATLAYWTARAVKPTPRRSINPFVTSPQHVIIRRQEARNAYLYVEGARGLFVEMAVVAFYQLNWVLWVWYWDADGELLLWVLVALQITVAIATFHLVYRAVPLHVFDGLGIPAVQRPWWRYIWYTFLFSTVSFAILVGLFQLLGRLIFQ